MKFNDSNIDKIMFGSAEVTKSLFNNATLYSNAGSYVNLVTNGDYSGGTTGHTGTSGVLSVNEGNLHLAASASATDSRINHTLKAPFESGKPYLIKKRYKVNGADCTSITGYIGLSGEQTLRTTPAADTWYTFEQIITGTATSLYRTYQKYAAAATGRVLELDYDIVVDLSGVAPENHTIEWCEEHVIPDLAW
jgi:hypothetical protein